MKGGEGGLARLRGGYFGRHRGVLGRQSLCPLFQCPGGLTACELAISYCARCFCSTLSFAFANPDSKEAQDVRDTSASRILSFAHEGEENSTALSNRALASLTPYAAQWVSWSH